MTTMGGNGSGGKLWLRILLGLGLLLPAVLCCVSVLVLPTFNTVLSSLQDKDFRRDAQFVGLANYERLFEDPRLAQALNLPLSLLVVRVLVVAVVPPLLAFLVNEFGRGVRIPVRLLFTVPLALFAPVAAALAWRRALSPRGGLVNAILEGMGLPPQQWLISVETAPGSLMLIEGLTTFGIACGVGLVFYLAALRGAGEEAPTWRRVWLPLVAAWAVGLLAAVVLPLPAFTTSWMLGGTGGGPGGAMLTLGAYLYRVGFVYMTFGYASAMATLLLAVALPLGLIAGLGIVFGGLRLEMVGWGKRSVLLSGEGKPGWLRIVAILLLAGVLLLSVAICGLSVLPVAESALTSLKSEAQLTDPRSPLWPASPATYVYDGPEVTYPFTFGEREEEVTLFPGDEYDVYRVPSEDGGEVHGWAMIVKRRDVSFFIDPANPEAGLIEWRGNWRTLETAWVFSPRWENYTEIGKLLQTPIEWAWINTIVPPLVVILLFQVPIVYLGALGIGVVRPFKKWSELLLLPFSPWLFVTVFPLSLAFFEGRAGAGLLNTWIGLAPPILLSVPMLFVLTLFFKGQEPKWRAAQAEGQSPEDAFFTKLILPSLPLVALLACVSLLLSLQDLLWPLIAAAGGRELWPAAVAVLALTQMYANRPPIVATAAILLWLPTLVFFFPAFGALQVFYLDRLALASHWFDGAGRGERPAVPAGAGAPPQEAEPAGEPVPAGEGDGWG